ncbi:hypothetical protein NDU88_005319 [Pleurodeles waltl]|uniref:Secreted protein n=1 Tax=Pleurodeles waltl TaxID=8319 RepID=A0AAV7QII0_PLEWA|nr:hypothetical protein NDU88_005319 [Pleurodeles waltl]
METDAALATFFVAWIQHRGIACCLDITLCRRQATFPISSIPRERQQTFLVREACPVGSCRQTLVLDGCLLMPSWVLVLE